jgi:hypothetical protein
VVTHSKRTSRVPDERRSEARNFFVLWKDDAEQMIDLGFVYKASTITETIEDLLDESGVSY